jgi:hypothetical protein
MHPTTNNLQMIPAKADNHRNQPPAKHIEWFLTELTVNATMLPNANEAYFCNKKNFRNLPIGHRRYKEKRNF